MQNKANFAQVWMNTSPFQTRDYRHDLAFDGPENKARLKENQQW